MSNQTNKTLKMCFSLQAPQERKIYVDKMLRKNGFVSQAFYERTMELSKVTANELRQMGKKLSTERGDPVFVFKDKAIVSDNFLREFVDEKTNIDIGTVNCYFKNKRGVCQSSARVFLEAVGYVRNVLERWDLYVDAEGNYRDIAIENMSAEVMYDLAMYSFVCEGIGYHCANVENGTKLHTKRKSLINALQKKFREIVQNGHGLPIFPKETASGERSWFIYICALIKYSYGINVFAGDGSDFQLAYITGKGETETENIIWIWDKIQIVNQTYNLLPKLENKKVKYWKICYERHTMAVIFCEETNSFVYLNCMGDFIRFDSSNGKSPVAKACRLITSSWKKKPKDDSVDKYLDFSLINFSSGEFNECFDFSVLEDVTFPPKW